MTSERVIDNYYWQSLRMAVTGLITNSEVWDPELRIHSAPEQVIQRVTKRLFGFVPEDRDLFEIRRLVGSIRTRDSHHELVAEKVMRRIDRQAFQRSDPQPEPDFHFPSAIRQLVKLLANPADTNFSSLTNMPPDEFEIFGALSADVLGSDRAAAIVGQLLQDRSVDIAKQTSLLNGWGPKNFGALYGEPNKPTPAKKVRMRGIRKLVPGWVPIISHSGDNSETQHSHDHHGHDHHHSTWAIAVALVFSVFQGSYGYKNKVATLFSDSIHGLNDAAAIALVKKIIPRFVKNETKAEITGAFLVGSMLFLSGVSVAFHAGLKVFSPMIPIAGSTVTLFGVIGAALNFAQLGLLSSSRDSGHAGDQALWDHIKWDFAGSLLAVTLGLSSTVVMATNPTLAPMLVPLDIGFSGLLAARMLKDGRRSVLTSFLVAASRRPINIKPSELSAFSKAVRKLLTEQAPWLGLRQQVSVTYKGSARSAVATIEIDHYKRRTFDQRLLEQRILEEAKLHFGTKIPIEVDLVHLEGVNSPRTERLNPSGAPSSNQSKSFPPEIVNLRNKRNPHPQDHRIIAKPKLQASLEH